MKLLVQPLAFMATTLFPHFVCSRVYMTPVSNSYSIPAILTLGSNIGSWSCDYYIYLVETLSLFV